jgi:iron complex outermembrane receptor protein
MIAIHKRNFKKALWVSILAISTAFPASSSAQNTGGLDEIIVTAQKREQSIQDTPIAVTALTQDFLESRAITNIKSLSSLAPNLKVESAPNNTTAAQISIRGGVTINPALTWEPTVGMYVNGAYLGKTQGSVFDVADIERIEVLRGPQGTLYGRNTLAGAINIITAKPTGEFGGKAEVGYGNYQSWHAKGSVDLDQIGPFKPKLSAMIQKRDGFVDGVANPFTNVTLANPQSATEHQNLDKIAFLAAVSADLTYRLTMDYTFDYSEADQNPVFSQIVSVSPNNIFDPTFAGYVGGGPFSGLYFGFPLDLYVNSERQDSGTTDGNIFERSLVRGHNLTFAYDLGNAELKSITAVRDLSWKDSLDIDGSPLLLAHTIRASDYDSFSQELQLTGQKDRLNYVLGAYYFKDDGYTENPQNFFGGANIFNSQYGFDTKAWALYGQADFAVTDQLTVTGGLRYTKEDKSIDRTNIGVVLSGALLNLPFVPAGTTGDETFSNLSPQAIIDYELNPNINLYAKYAIGYKSGGFNGEAQSVAETLRPYDEEKVRSIEFGAKTRLVDNKLQLNAALFFNKHKDMQLSIFTAAGAAGSDVRNAGKANINGFELEGLFQATDRLLLRGSVGVLDSEYKEFIEAGIDEANNRAFPHAPKTTFSAGFDARIWEGELGAFDLSADANHSAKYFTYPYSLTATDPQPAFNTQAPARTIVDARLAWTDLPVGNGNIELAIWAKNLFDKEYLANFIDFGPGFGGLTSGYFGDPQTYGVTLGVDW